MPPIPPAHSPPALDSSSHNQEREQREKIDKKRAAEREQQPPRQPAKVEGPRRAEDRGAGQQRRQLSPADSLLAPPQAKRPRMQLSLPGGHSHPGPSVAQRLKQSSLKDAKSLISSPPPPGGIGKGSSIGLKPCLVSPPVPRRLTTRHQNAVRIIAQFLHDLGLNETVEMLVNESGCKVENSHAVRLRKAILRGNWNDALELINCSYAHLKEDEMEPARSFVLEEKFYDLLFRQEKSLALRLLREDYPNRKNNQAKRASMMRMLYMDWAELCNVPEVARFKWSKERRRKFDQRRLITRLQGVLPPSFMLPPNRLEELFEQAWKYQLSKCVVHAQPRMSESIDPTILFADHNCDSETNQTFFHTTQTISDYPTEVWMVKFSPDGEYLATASHVTIVFIWKVNKEKKTMQLERKLKVRDTPHGIGGMSWSHDSVLLAVCGMDEHPHQEHTREHVFWSSYPKRNRLVVYNVKQGRVHRTIQAGQDFSFTAVAFFNNSSHLLAVGGLRGHLQVYDIDKQDGDPMLRNLEGYRIRNVYGMKDGKTVIAADTHNRVRSWDSMKQEDELLFTEEGSIISMCVHPKEKMVLLVCKKLGLRLWSLESRSLMRSFVGADHGEFTINACFGGNRNMFIASGSVDNNIYIWRLSDSTPLAKLKGHRGLVNTVAWNPEEPLLLASGADDATIRLWSSKKVDSLAAPAKGTVRRVLPPPPPVKKECTV